MDNNDHNCKDHDTNYCPCCTNEGGVYRYPDGESECGYCGWNGLSPWEKEHLACDDSCDCC